MGEPRAITYKEVSKAFKTDAEAREAWSDIGTISGAGNVPPSELASIDITELSDDKRTRIDKLLVPDAPKKAGGNQ
jgi:hypothetical protein